MEEKISWLSVSECETVGELLYELIQKCPHIPAGVKVHINSTDATKSIGVFTLNGSKYVKKFVNGGFVAQVFFRVAYKSMPTTDKQRLESQAVVDRIMSWLENVKELPPLSDDRTATEITASNSAAFLESAESNKTMGFASDAVMEYYKEVKFSF